VAKRRYSKKFREFAVERLRGCENIVALAKELHVSRSQPIGGGTSWIPRYRDASSRAEFARIQAAQRGEPFEAGLGGKDLGSGFFQKCLAKSRGSTPAERQVWREGIYEQLQEMMPLQGGLSVERMCELAPVSRAGFYRWVQEPPARRRGNGSAVFDSADRDRTSAALWIPARFCGAAAARDGREPQASDTDHARG
jgi:hypothetical protein